MSTMAPTASGSVCSPGSASSPAGHSMHPECTTLADDSSFEAVGDPERGRGLGLPPPGPSYVSYPSPHSSTVGYNPPTPFPSRANGSWLHPSLASSWSGYPKSLSSYLNQKDFPSSAGAGGRSLSPPGSSAVGSLEQPLSLCSDPPSASLRHHRLPPYSCPPQGAGCFAQRPPGEFSSRGALLARPPWPPHHPANGTRCKSAPTGGQPSGFCRRPDTPALLPLCSSFLSR